jgi:hypothetical protein
MHDGTVFLMAEKEIFRVDRTVLQRDSDRFRRLFAATADVENDGSSNERAILLENTKALDFKRFVNLLYPLGLAAPAYSTVEEWTSILRVAHYWGFQSIRSLATLFLFPLASSVDKVALSYEFDESAWLLDAYVDLCTQSEVISTSDAERLGMMSALNIWRAREALRNAEISESDMRSIVHRICCPNAPISSGGVTQSDFVGGSVLSPSQNRQAVSVKLLYDNPPDYSSMREVRTTPCGPEELIYLQSKVEDLVALNAVREEECYRMQAELEATQLELSRIDEAWTTRYQATVERMQGELEASQAAAIVASADVTSNVTQILLSTLEELRNVACTNVIAADDEIEDWDSAIAGQDVAMEVNDGAIEQHRRDLCAKKEVARKAMAALDELTAMITERLA